MYVRTPGENRTRFSGLEHHIVSKFEGMSEVVALTLLLRVIMRLSLARRR